MPQINSNSASSSTLKPPALTQNSHPSPSLNPIGCKGGIKKYTEIKDASVIEITRCASHRNPHIRQLTQEERKEFLRQKFSDSNDSPNLDAIADTLIYSRQASQEGEQRLQALEDELNSFTLDGEVESKPADDYGPSVMPASQTSASLPSVINATNGDEPALDVYHLLTNRVDAQERDNRDEGIAAPPSSPEIIPLAILLNGQAIQQDNNPALANVTQDQGFNIYGHTSIFDLRALGEEAPSSSLTSLTSQ